MIKNMLTVKVTRRESLDSKPVLVETIERQQKHFMVKEGTRWVHRGSKVFYKGKYRKVFVLPECYDECAGMCIDDSPEWLYW